MSLVWLGRKAEYTEQMEVWSTSSQERVRAGRSWRSALRTGEGIQNSVSKVKEMAKQTAKQAMHSETVKRALGCGPHPMGDGKSGL